MRPVLITLQAERQRVVSWTKMDGEWQRIVVNNGSSDVRRYMHAPSNVSSCTLDILHETFCAFAEAGTASLPPSMLYSVAGS